MTSRREFDGSGVLAFALVYLTFFLDNVLLTVLVPIVPELLSDDDTDKSTSLPVYAVNTSSSSGTMSTATGGGGGAAAGAVLGAKAGAQLVCAARAGAAVSERGAVAVLRAATAALAAASAVCCVWAPGRSVLVACLCAGRALQGAGAAGAGVAGLALVTSVSRSPGRGVAPLLGAVALGVLVGYPFGGAAYKLWSRAAPFQIITLALLLNTAMQWIFLDKSELNQRASFMRVPGAGGRRSALGAALVSARREAAAPCAGAVLLTTMVMAALEPCLPVWLMHKFHPQRWVLGAVFVPDSVAYLAATAGAAGVARVAGVEVTALAGQAAVGLAALALPYAPTVWWLAVPHATLGVGLGLADGALVPAVLARAPRSVPQRASLLQAASSAAYTFGPVVGGLVSWGVGFESLLRALGVTNLLYVAFLYRALRRYPLTEQWGASTPDDEEDLSEELQAAPEGCGGRAGRYTALRDDTSSPL